MGNSTSNDPRTYAKKVWVVVGITVLAVTIMVLLYALFNVLLMVLAGLLIAVYFRGFAQIIGKYTHWPSWVTLLVSVLVSVVLLTALSVFIGAEVQNQISELAETLPTGIKQIKEEINKSPVGQRLLKEALSIKSQQKLGAVAGRFFSSTFGGIGDLYIIIFLGLFLTVNPAVYKKGMLQLVPPGGRQKALYVLEVMWLKLTKWLKGSLIAMLVVMVLTLTGLLIIGLPMALALAIIAGLLNFIPNFGPLLAMVPAVLVGFMQGSNTALLVAGLYIFIQVVESNFITPMVQQKLVSIPPALIIIGQLIMASLTGFLGILLATPVVLLLMVLTNELYVKPINNE